jgi:hypothetical protein
METDLIYEHYRTWLQRMGIAPAPPEVYLKESAKCGDFLHHEQQHKRRGMDKTGRDRIHARAKVPLRLE